MQSESEKILLQGQQSLLHILRDVLQNDLLIIELIRSGESRPVVLAAVGHSVRSGLYTLDDLGDHLRELLRPNL